MITGAYGTVKEAVKLIHQNKPDLLLLDVQLPDGTGFDVLHETTTDLKVIFLTAFEKHAIQAIKTGALDYLLKPIDEQELREALAKVSRFYPAKPEQVKIAQRFHEDRIRSRLVLRSEDSLQIVEVGEIVYCQGDAGYTHFFMANAKKLVTSKVLKEYEDVLPEPFFLRCHQSYLVNSRFIEQYKKEGYLVLKNGMTIPVAGRRKETIVGYLNQL